MSKAKPPDTEECERAHTNAEEVRRLLLVLHEKHGTWRAVSKNEGLADFGFLAQVARGHRAPSQQLFRAFGFSVPRVVELLEGYGVGEACKTCGQVHTTKQCPARRAQRVRRLHELSDEEIRAAFENRVKVQ